MIASPARVSPRARGDLARWYRRCVGRALEAAEADELAAILPRLYGHHLLQVTSLSGRDLAAHSAVVHRVFVDPQGPGEGLPVHLRAKPDALPVASDSVAAVILRHTLEFEDNPYQILREVDRVLVADGHVLIFGFNPYSLWGVWRLLRWSRHSGAWGGRVLAPGRVRDWIALLGFEIMATRYHFYRPPIDHARLIDKLGGLEGLGRRFWPALGSGYLLVGRKRVMPLTLIKPRWRPRRGLVPGGVIEPSARG
jgi:SAM-dependent methyltransferase